MDANQKAILAHVVENPDAWWAHAQTYAQTKHDQEQPVLLAKQAALQSAVAAVTADDQAATAQEQGTIETLSAAVVSAQDAEQEKRTRRLLEGTAASTQAARTERQQRIKAVQGDLAAVEARLALTPAQRAQQFLAEKCARWKPEFDRERVKPQYKARAERGGK